MIKGRQGFLLLLSILLLGFFSCFSVEMIVICLIYCSLRYLSFLLVHGFRGAGEELWVLFLLIFFPFLVRWVFIAFVSTFFLILSLESLQLGGLSIVDADRIDMRGWMYIITWI